MKIILDSDILINHFRRRTQVDLLTQLVERTHWYMSSVVAMELHAGCRSKRDARTLEKFLRPFERTGRIVSPDHRTWVRAGAVLADLGSRLGVEPMKRRTLANDALIGLSAVAIGAAVVTGNATDFETLARAIPLIWFGSVEEALRVSVKPRRP